MKTIHRFLVPFLSLALALSSFGFAASIAEAAALTTLSDTLSTVKVSTAANNDICFVSPTGVASGATIIVTLPATWSIAAGLTFTDVDVLTGATCSGATNVTLAAAPSGATWGVARTSATVLTATNGTTVVAAGQAIRIKIGTNATNQSTGTNQVTNGSSTGAAANGILITGTFGDTGTISVPLVSDDTVAVSATVAQSITFSLSSNTISFGTLDSAAAHYANTTTGATSDTVAHTLAVSTNAPTGYTITLKGATLTSQQNASNSITAIGSTPATSSVGTKQFGIYATKSGGVNGTIATPYVTASSFGYGATATSSDTLASGTSATATETYSLHYLANISATTEAGTYSSTLNYVATANF